MRRLALATVFLLVCPIALAQMLCHAMAGPGGISPCAKKLATAVHQEEFEKVSWPALMDSLKSSPGMPFFRQGLTQYYGLDYEEAMRNFKEAKKDPNLTAMASWGIALAAGPNINLNMTDACLKLACDEIQCADSLAGGKSKQGCEPGKYIATALEKELIAALKQRYVCRAGELIESQEDADVAAKKYSDALAVVSTNHPNDKNVSTLYAESMMDLHPWDQYDKAGLPKREQTNTIVDVLKKSVGDSLEAIGANHFYIHAVEGSNPSPDIGKIHPIDALPSANLLQDQVAKSGHLVHMSSHIYLLLGKYEKSLDANVKAVANDVDQYGDVCRGTYEAYTTNSACPQLYYGHYLSHNYFFGSVSATFTGQSKEAAKLACATSAHVERFVIYEPGLQRYMTAPLMTLVVNRNWDKILKYPEPPNDCYRQPPFKEDSGCHIVRSIWYWARGMAHATLGDLGAASTDFKNMKSEERTIEKHPPRTWGNNEAVKVLAIAEWMLNARIHWARKNKITTFSSLSVAFHDEDELSYDEPPQWFTPAREALGGAYLQAKQYGTALKVFEAALDRHPASGRALYGKVRALQGMHAPQAEIDKIIKNEYCPAWQYSDYTMTDEDLWPAVPGEKNVDKITCPAREQKVTKPSECTCPATKWPPVGVADLTVDKLECAN